MGSSYTRFVALLIITSGICLCVTCKIFVTRSFTSSQVIIYDSLMKTAEPVSSAVECAELCYNKSECRGSMLYSTTCLLYGKAKRANSQLPYKIFKADVGETWQDMSDTCQQQGMHLLAINSQLEQATVVTKVIQYFGEYHSNDCVKIKHEQLKVHQIHES